MVEHKLHLYTITPVTLSEVSFFTEQLTRDYLSIPIPHNCSVHKCLCNVYSPHVQFNHVFITMFLYMYYEISLQNALKKSILYFISFMKTTPKGISTLIFMWMYIYHIGKYYKTMTNRNEESVQMLSQKLDETLNTTKC